MRRIVFLAVLLSAVVAFGGSATVVRAQGPARAQGAAHVALYPLVSLRRARAIMRRRLFGYSERFLYDPSYQIARVYPISATRTAAANTAVVHGALAIQPAGRPELLYVSCSGWVWRSLRRVGYGRYRKHIPCVAVWL